MMDGWDSDMGVFGWIVMTFHWVGVVALIVWAVANLFPGRAGRAESASERPEAVGAAAATAGRELVPLAPARTARTRARPERGADRVGPLRGARVPVLGEDELGRLGAAFNQLAGSLESAELRRRRLLSELAHELRTPLATIDGYLTASFLRESAPATLTGRPALHGAFISRP